MRPSGSSAACPRRGRAFPALLLALLLALNVMAHCCCSASAEQPGSEAASCHGHESAAGDCGGTGEGCSCESPLLVQIATPLEDAPDFPAGSLALPVAAPLAAAENPVRPPQLEWDMPPPGPPLPRTGLRAPPFQA